MTDKLPPALDVACGARSFYFDKDDERVLNIAVLVFCILAGIAFAFSD
nr:MAG TPA: Insulin insulin, hormone, glucose metabolism.92A [Caudoviricetes sp.]